jgi:hypothetical protein
MPKILYIESDLLEGESLGDYHRRVHPAKPSRWMIFKRQNKA